MDDIYLICIYIHINLMENGISKTRKAMNMPEVEREPTLRLVGLSWCQTSRRELCTLSLGALGRHRVTLYLRDTMTLGQHCCRTGSKGRGRGAYSGSSCRTRLTSEKQNSGEERRRWMIRGSVEMDLPSGRRLPCVDLSTTELKSQSKKRCLHRGA